MIINFNFVYYSINKSIKYKRILRIKWFSHTFSFNKCTILILLYWMDPHISLRCIFFLLIFYAEFIIIYKGLILFSVLDDNNALSSSNEDPSQYGLCKATSFVRPLNVVLVIFLYCSLVFPAFSLDVASSIFRFLDTSRDHDNPCSRYTLIDKLILLYTHHYREPPQQIYSYN